MASSSHPLATEIAICALEKGGSAVDAYLAAAFAQTVLEPPMTTLAGGLGLGYFDNKTGELYQCGGGFGAPAAETGDWSVEESLTARPTMVPGFVRGAELAHKQFGKLSWAELLEPAIVLAEEGFIIDHLLWAWTYERRNFAGRYPSGQAIWFPNGHLRQPGDRFRQPELAATLKRLRAEGPDYFYTGAWAKRFVAAVRDRGGRMTLEDVAKYQPFLAESWTPGPGRGEATVTYRDYQVGPEGRATFGLACSLMEIGDLRGRGRPTESADALYCQIRIMQEIWHAGLQYRREDHDAFVSKEHARKVWRAVESGPPRPFRGLFEGTCALTIVDGDGNVAAGTHSSTSAAYGIGLFVDGVVVNRVT
jgi:gamma-glutamyltranspeptidase/glutathione hydrolase